MAARFQCPKCKAVQTLHPRLMGRLISCPKCSESIQLPTQESLDAAKQEREFAKRLAAAKVSAAAKISEVPTQAVKPAVIESEEELEVAERRSLPHDHIDMTPMVDITFLLLIFFMSTANFTLQKSLEVPVQKDNKASTNAVPITDDVRDSVTVQIDEFNAYTILMGDGTEREAPSKQDLIIALDEARNSAGGTTPPEKLLVQAHRDCMHSAVIAALDAGRDKEFSAFQVTVVEEFD